MEQKGFNIRGYAEAEQIVKRGFERNEAYMRDLIADVTGDGDYVDGLNYGGLLRDTRRILSVAEKMLESRKAKTTRLEDKSSDTPTTEVQGTLF